MDSEKMKSIIEALLIASDRPLTIEKISAVVEDDDKQRIRSVISQLQMDYETGSRGFQLNEIAGGFQFSARPQYAEYLKKLYGERITPRLSRAGLETLAIIAYKQPITRMEIEGIRGVGTTGVLQTLLERSLVKIRGRKEVIGRPLLYGTTTEFLKYFGLKDLTELPKIEELAELLDRAESQSPAAADSGGMENQQQEQTSENENASTEEKSSPE